MPTPSRTRLARRRADRDPHSRARARAMAVPSVNRMRVLAAHRRFESVRSEGGSLPGRRALQSRRLHRDVPSTTYDRGSAASRRSTALPSRRCQARRPPSLKPTPGSRAVDASGSDGARERIDVGIHAGPGGPRWPAPGRRQSPPSLGSGRRHLAVAGRRSVASLTPGHRLCSGTRAALSRAIRRPMRSIARVTRRFAVPNDMLSPSRSRSFHLSM